GNGGRILLDVGELSVSGGAKISSQTGTNGGVGGNVTVNAPISVALSGKSSGIFSDSGAARPGDISLDVGKLTLTGGAQIRSGSTATRGGNVTITASESVAISDTSGISSQSPVQDGGQVAISGRLGTSRRPAMIMDNGFVNTSTLGAGRAGDISLNVGTLALTGGAQIVSSSQQIADDLSATRE